MNRDHGSPGPASVHTSLRRRLPGASPTVRRLRTLDPTKGHRSTPSDQPPRRWSHPGTPCWSFLGLLHIVEYLYSVADFAGPVVEYVALYYRNGLSSACWRHRGHTLHRIPVCAEGRHDQQQDRERGYPPTSCWSSFQFATHGYRLPFCCLPTRITHHTQANNKLTPSSRAKGSFMLGLPPVARVSAGVSAPDSPIPPPRLASVAVRQLNPG